MKKEIVKEVNKQEKQLNKVKNESPIIFRYERYFDEENNYMPSSKGGVTYAFRINYDKGIADAGIAVCSINDNFSKKYGRSIAKKRLDSDPIRFKYQTPNSELLIDVFWRNYYAGALSLSVKNDRIINSIKFNVGIF